MIEKAQVLEVLYEVQDPEPGKSLVELGMVRDVEITERAYLLAGRRALEG